MAEDSYITKAKTFPSEFVSLLHESGYPPTLINQMLESLRREATVSIRLNRNKLRHGLPPLLQELENGRVGWLPPALEGYYLSQRPYFAHDPLWHAGAYYVQEASSMIVGYLIETLGLGEQPIVAMDLCAAPGGKSLLLRDTLHRESVLISNEVNPSRAKVLLENLSKWNGLEETIVTQSTTARLAQALPRQAQLVLVDAPCSGEGLFRKDVQAIEMWSCANVNHCVDRQKEILSDAHQLLASQGWLIYSTCTLNSKENEEVVEWMCATYGYEPVEVPMEQFCEEAHVFPSRRVGWHFLPGIVRGEGLYVAVLRKNHTDCEEPDPQTNRRMFHESSQTKNKRRKGAKGAREATGRSQANQSKWLEVCLSWLDEPDAECLSIEEAAQVSFLSPFAGKLKALCRERRVPVLGAGIYLAQVLKEQPQPRWPLAMTMRLRREAFPTYDLTQEQALRYLRGEALPTDGFPKAHSFVLLLYQQIPLGFAKQVSGRLNNLYPKEYKLRT